MNLYMKKELTNEQLMMVHEAELNIISKIK